MLEEKNKSKASLKEKELVQRKLVLDFEKQKYEDQAKETEQRLSMELEERKMFLSLLIYILFLYCLSVITVMKCCRLCILIKLHFLYLMSKLTHL